MTVVMQDPNRPHVTWFSPGPRDARLAEMTTALRHIRTLAHDWQALAVDPSGILESIALIACDALAGAEPEPCATAEVVI